MATIQRYAWTPFLLLAALLFLFGLSDWFSPGADSTLRDDALNELFIALITLVIAVTGLRRGERWAWYAMAVWPVWIVAQGLRTLTSGKSAEAISAVIFLVVAVAALALSYRRPMQRQS